MKMETMELIAIIIGGALLALFIAAMLTPRTEIIAVYSTRSSSKSEKQPDPGILDLITII